jgi:two-component system sensor histidine kinase and response regulator WspE
MSQREDFKVNKSLFDMFRPELETQIETLTTALSALSSKPTDDDAIENCMRATVSIKGAAQLVKIQLVLKLSLAIEDFLTFLQASNLKITPTQIDSLNAVAEYFSSLSKFTINEHQQPDKNIVDKRNKLITSINAYSLDKNKASQNNTTSTVGNNTDTSIHTPVNIDSVDKVIFSTPDNIDPVMLDLFRTELENNITIISTSLLELENDPKDPQHLEQLMRASHSIKGAARLLEIEAVVKIAHTMEDCFVAAQNKTLKITDDHTDILLKCIDILKEISSLSTIEHASWTLSNSHNISSLIHSLKNIEKHSTKPSNNTQTVKIKKTADSQSNAKIKPAASKNNGTDNFVRVNAKRINKLISLAGELTVSSNWIRNHSQSMLGLKKKHNELIDSIDRLQVILEQREISALEKSILNTVQRKSSQYRETLTSHIIALDEFDRRSSSLSASITHEVIATRMRPFKDSTQGYKRMVRDISRSLNKKIKLEIIGEEIQVDRDILEKIEAPINHMIRNAIDHGIETPAERKDLNKPETGIIKLKAAHNAGRLSITVSDDGRGVDIENIRTKVLHKKLVNKAMADTLSKSELLDFLFLPSFSTRDNVTEISGRGVGLNVVHSTLQEMRGKLHSQTEPGKGMSIHMELPLTLSVIRSLLVKINNELYAFPLAAINNLINIEKSAISTLEDKQYITFNEHHIGLIHSAQILGVVSSPTDKEYLSVIVIGDWNNLYGLVVDEIIGERNLALRPLDSRLGKVKDINSSALTDNGEPILIFDVDDLIQSVRDIISGKSIQKIGHDLNTDKPNKRILVVDDSLTVREIEKKLLESRAYYVDIAIDGVDAWNAVRHGNYNLVITDVDMPRMNGIELVILIKNDAALRNIPVMMVSYKDRPEDKQKGLEAGADYYLTKGSFHDETLVDAVRDLIGDPI